MKGIKIFSPQDHLDLWRLRGLVRGGLGYNPLIHFNRFTHESFSPHLKIFRQGSLGLKIACHSAKLFLKLLPGKIPTGKFLSRRFPPWLIPPLGKFPPPRMIGPQENSPQGKFLPRKYSPMDFGIQFFLTCRVLMQTQLDPLTLITLTR